MMKKQNKKSLMERLMEREMQQPYVLAYLELAEALKK